MGSGFTQLALVMTGGALGAALRFWLGGALLKQFGERLPWGTLAANLIGAFAAGFLAVWLQQRGPAAVYWRAFLMVGVLGALTTYSALMLELMLQTKGERWGDAATYLAITLIGGMTLVFAGARIAQAFRPL